ncbi:MULTISPECIES: dehydrogenase [Rothia]|uniref:dehydrogenase n=1 Tax=Rothia nasimurium TaxID=85336 RepID=UPI00162A0D17|nr:dehydrogenase [Rothia nasimurium]
MGIKDFLQSRRDDAELGKGLWRRAHDRFVRGLDRFHQILERVPAGPTLEELVPLANDLADLLPRVRTVAAEAQRLAPSESNDIPASPTGVYSDLHRALSKAGNSLALCAEALAMTRCAGECGTDCTRTATIAHRVETVQQHVADAEARLDAARQEALAPAS